ncbi:MAG: fumarate reductase subunit C [Deltaproteobacteria bacterium]|nr:fumarate reductase subunit C [Deltaproteobacteria bacterium]
MATKRKPYVRESGRCWWKGNPCYRFYMLREGSSVFSIWVGLLLLLFLFSPAVFSALIKNPLVRLLNSAALLAALLHTKTWYELAPRALNLPEEKLAVLVKGLWTATIAFSALALLFSLT